MFNKYQRDKHLTNIKDLTRRKMVTGYLNDDHFDNQINISRTLASPRKKAPEPEADGMDRNKSVTPPPLNEADKLTLELEEAEKHMLA